MQCPHCAAEVANDAKFCGNCGTALNNTPTTAENQVPAAQALSTPPAPPYQQASYQPYDSAHSNAAAQVSVDAQPIYAMSETKRTLSLVCFILCVISCVGVGWTIIPLIWMIPMTMRVWGIYKGTKPNTTTFGICTLLFLNLVGGILLLVADKDA